MQIPALKLRSCVTVPRGRNRSESRRPKLTHEHEKTKTDVCQEQVVRPSGDGVWEEVPCSCWAGRPVVLPVSPLLLLMHVDRPPARFHHLPSLSLPGCRMDVLSSIPLHCHGKQGPTCGHLCLGGAVWGALEFSETRASVLHVGKALSPTVHGARAAVVRPTPSPRAVAPPGADTQGPHCKHTGTVCANVS